MQFLSTKLNGAFQREIGKGTLYFPSIFPQTCDQNTSEAGY